MVYGSKKSCPNSFWGTLAKQGQRLGPKANNSIIHEIPVCSQHPFRSPSQFCISPIMKTANASAAATQPLGCGRAQVLVLGFDVWV